MRLSADRKRALEVELALIKNVGFSSILLGDNGEIASVDVISDTERNAKHVARDVEIILRKHDLGVDRKKIGVVQMDQPDRVRAGEAPRVVEPGVEPGVEPAILTVVPGGERVQLNAVHSTMRDGSLAVEVELTLGPYDGIPGRADGPGTDETSSVALVARATLEAVRNLLQPGYEALLKEARILEAVGRPLVVVVVDFGAGRKIETMVGACIQRGSLYDTAVYATLDAINRPLGQASYRTLAYLEEDLDAADSGAA